MAYEQRPGTISVFSNRFKKDDRHPDYKPMKNETVSCPHCDQDMDIALWQRRTKAGDAYFSVKLSVPRPRTEADRLQRNARNEANPYSDEDIPY